MEDNSYWILVGAGGVFIGFIVIYVTVMIIWPEWVGITGKVALKAEESHRSGTVEVDTDITARLQKSSPRGEGTSGKADSDQS